jgi:hypothetical protein
MKEQERIEKYGLSDEEWETYVNKYTEPILLGLIKKLSPYFTRKFYDKRMRRDSDTVTIPVETGLGKPTIGVQMSRKDLEPLIRAGKKMEDILEVKGRGISKRIREEG